MKVLLILILLALRSSSDAQKFTLEELITLRAQSPKGAVALLKAKKYEFDKVSTPFNLYTTMRWESINQEDSVYGMKAIWYGIDRHGRRHVDYNFVTKRELVDMEKALKQKGFRKYQPKGEVPSEVLMELKRGKIIAILIGRDATGLYTVKLNEE